VRPVRTLLVDNHDSYTFNLFHLIAEVNGVEPVVLPNDSAELTTRYLDEFDNVVLSPGAGRPQVARDLGRVAELLLATTIPLLGVCLGHQAIGHAAGAIVEDAPQPRHGHLSSIKHDGDDLFAGLPNGFVAVRYHSLCVREPLPDVLAATAWAEDGVVMGLRHRLLPRWGVQFHPESVASQHGHQLMANFRRLSARARTRPAVSLRAPAAPGDTAQHRPSGTWTAPPEPPAFVLTHTVLTGAADTEAVFTEFFASASPSFWLDSSRAEPGLARFSFLGDASGPLGEVLTYRVGDGQVRVRDRAGQHVERGTVLDVLEQRLRARRIAAPGLPFDFTCGYVGYFGYEMRADCGAEATQVAETPDAVWIFADQLIAVDHEHDLTYVLAVHRRGGDADSAAAWVSATARRVRALAARRRAGERDDPATTKRVTWTAPAGLATNRDVSSPADAGRELRDLPHHQGAGAGR
jgi:para-aminobenzoate synthetase